MSVRSPGSSLSTRPSWLFVRTKAVEGAWVRATALDPDDLFPVLQVLESRPPV